MTDSNELKMMKGQRGKLFPGYMDEASAVSGPSGFFFFHVRVTRRLFFDSRNSPLASAQLSASVLLLIPAVSCWLPPRLHSNTEKRAREVQEVLRSQGDSKKKHISGRSDSPRSDEGLAADQRRRGGASSRWAGSENPVPPLSS